MASYRIIERFRTTILPDHLHGEFGRVHSRERWIEVERLGPEPIVIKKLRGNYKTALKWAKKRNLRIVEIR